MRILGQGAEPGDVPMSWVVLGIISGVLLRMTHSIVKLERAVIELQKQSAWYARRDGASGDSP